MGGTIFSLLALSEDSFVGLQKFESHVESFKLNRRHISVIEDAAASTWLTWLPPGLRVLLRWSFLPFLQLSRNPSTPKETFQANFLVSFPQSHLYFIHNARHGTIPPTSPCPSLFYQIRYSWLQRHPSEQAAACSDIGRLPKGLQCRQHSHWHKANRRLAARLGHCCPIQVRMAPPF